MLILKACCAPFDGDGCWYRAEVIGIPTPFTVLVRVNVCNYFFIYLILCVGEIC